MIIQDITSFLDYYKRIRVRTIRVIKCIPPDKIEWTYQEGKFTLGDLVRHLACIERYMYGETVQQKPSKYSGCGKEYAEGYDQVMVFFDRMHQESMEIFGRLTEEDLNKKCITPGDIPITIWKWLRLMVEHEIHHRGQLYMYLAVLGVETPPLYGMTSEQVADQSKNSE